MTFKTEKDRIIAEKDAEIINLRKTCSELWDEIDKREKERNKLMAENEKLTREIKKLNQESQKTFQHIMKVYDEDHDESR